MFNSLIFSLKKNIKEINQGGVKILFRKLFSLFKIITNFFLCLLSIPILLLIYLVSSKFLIRFQPLISNRIGHFAGNTELYLCEKDMKINTPTQNYLDLFFCHDVCNFQLYKMWKKKINIMPKWILYPFFKTNKILSKFFTRLKKHEIGNNTFGDKDVLNLMDRSEPSLKFSTEEEVVGRKYLSKFNLNENSKFIALSIRDNNYLKNKDKFKDWSYHNYRDQDINNYILALNELTNKGYHIFKMGTKGSNKINSSNPKIIDYANSNLKSDFLDIYLSAKCSFFISGQTGLDAIPRIFRKPIISILTLEENFPACVFSTKEYILFRPKYKKSQNKTINLYEYLALRHEEIVGFKDIENHPKEILDIALEVEHRLSNKWKGFSDEVVFQKKFWDKFTYYFKNNRNIVFNGKIKARVGYSYLKNIFNEKNMENRIL